MRSRRKSVSVQDVMFMCAAEERSPFPADCSPEAQWRSGGPRVKERRKTARGGAGRDKELLVCREALPELIIIHAPSDPSPWAQNAPVSCPSPSCSENPDDRVRRFFVSSSDSR